VSLLIQQLEEPSEDDAPIEYLSHAFLDPSLLLVCAGQRLWCLYSFDNRVEKVWHLPLNAVEDITFAKEPDFPAVRIAFVNPSAFVRYPKPRRRYVYFLAIFKGPLFFKKRAVLISLVRRTLIMF
jgi:hypothetical protein